MNTQFSDLSLGLTTSYLRPTRLGQVDDFCEGPPPTSLIFSPSEGQRITGEDVLVKGYAIASIFSEIESVELSLDGGTTWIPAELSPNPQPGEWRLWRKHLHLKPGPCELLARATDNQPNRALPDAKLKWHRIYFEVTQ